MDTDRMQILKNGICASLNDFAAFHPHSKATRYGCDFVLYCIFNKFYHSLLQFFCIS